MRGLEPLGPVQIEASREIASRDALRVILGNTEGGQDVHLFLTEFPPQATGEVAGVGLKDDLRTIAG